MGEILMEGREEEGRSFNYFFAWFKIKEGRGGKRF
jgi:hypothetical protein